MMHWIDITMEKPEWNEWVIVYRGHTDMSEGWRGTLPPFVEYTNKSDHLITHWMRFLPPDSHLEDQ